MDAHSPKRMPSCSAALAPDRYQLRTELLACRSSGWAPHERACAAARAVDRTPHDHPAQQRPRMPYARPPCNGSRHVQCTPLHGMRVFGIELQAAAFFALVRKVGTETAARPSRWCTVAPTRGAVCLHPKLTHPSPRFELGARCVWVRPPAPAQQPSGPRWAASVRKGLAAVGRADPGGRRRGDLTRGTRR